MNKLKFYSVFTVICYGIFLLTGILLAGGMLFIFVKDNPDNNLGVAIAKVLAIAITIISGFYVAIMTVPFILRIISIKKPHPAFPVICLPFDVFSLISHIVLMRGGIFSGNFELFGVLLSVFLTLLSVVTIVFNSLSIAKYKKPSAEEEDFEIR